MSALSADPPLPATALRPMREADLAAVHAVEIRAYEFPWTLGIFRDCLHADYPAWVLDVDGRVGGYFLMSIAAGEAHVLNVCVAPELQGAGHGRALLRAPSVCSWKCARATRARSRCTRPRGSTRSAGARALTRPATVARTRW